MRVTPSQAGLDRKSDASGLFAARQRSAESCQEVFWLVEEGGKEVHSDCSLSLAFMLAVLCYFLYPGMLVLDKSKGR